MRCLVVLHRPPAASESTPEAIELAMALTNFSNECALWLKGDAIQWVSADLVRERLGRFDTTRLLKALPFYEIEEIWALEGERPVNIIEDVPITWLSEATLRERLASIDLIFGE